MRANWNLPFAFWQKKNQAWNWGNARWNWGNAPYTINGWVAAEVSQKLRNHVAHGLWCIPVKQHWIPCKLIKNSQYLKTLQYEPTTQKKKKKKPFALINTILYVLPLCGEERRGEERKREECAIKWKKLKILKWN